MIGIISIYRILNLTITQSHILFLITFYCIVLGGCRAQLQYLHKMFDKIAMKFKNEKEEGLKNE